MESPNVYIRARRIVRELAPLLRVVREQDKALADQLKRAAQSVVNWQTPSVSAFANSTRAAFSA